MTVSIQTSHFCNGVGGFPTGCRYGYTMTESPSSLLSSTDTTSPSTAVDPSPNTASSQSKFDFDAVLEILQLYSGALKDWRRNPIDSDNVAKLKSATAMFKKVEARREDLPADAREVFDIFRRRMSGDMVSSKR
ncbi:hypothetical protein D9611_010519 [Ephemerocybe angulata]|uniref:Uncharacterized protein n=1 Tax=Ephemerocybe angulata TaxID=980116 RepID=A0A8H5BWW3_9AGAR|nr:hypothetical protein D9611_010519 [Tulosesus angulatus]